MPQIQEQQQVNITINDLIYAQVKDLGNRMDRLEKGFESTRTELNARMDRLERRQDRLEEKLERTRQELNARMDKQDAKIEKLADKIDRLADKMDSFSYHGQKNIIATANLVIAEISAGVMLFVVVYSILK